MDRPRAELWLAPPTLAQDWPRLAASLWPRACSAPTCLIAPLAGDALLLGRYQCAATALANLPDLPSARRATGGRTLRAGQGCWALAMSLPHAGALLPGGTKVPALKIVNRSVRPVLGALATLGVSAGYFGRDVITTAQKPLAYVSFDSQDDGKALFEALVGFERPLWPGAHSLPRRPSADEWVQALRRGFEERLAATLGEPHPAPPPAEPSWPEVYEELPPRPSRLHEIAIGHLEARVEIDQLATQRTGSRILARARVLGDFQADSPSVARLEQSLTGSPLEEIPLCVDGVFGPHGSGTIVGLKSLRTIADALIEAAGVQL